MSYVAQRNVVCVQPDGIGLLMDVFVPTAANAPAKGYGLVCVASGGWTSPRRVTEAHEAAGYFRELCQRGFTVFAVRPGSSSAFTIDQMVAYVHMMIREIRSRAKAGEYAIKTDWLGLTGVSAGGHLAALSAIRGMESDAAQESAAVQTVGLLCPATDLLDWGGVNGAKYGPFMKDFKLIFPGGAEGKTEEQKEKAARAVSPIYQARAGLPPFFIAHGDKDDAVPVAHAEEKLTKALGQVGVPVKYVVIPGGNHDWPQLIGQVGPMADWLVGQLPPRGV